MPSSPASSGYCRKMDLSMVLNVSKEEKCDEKAEWQLQQPGPLPPMRTQPPMSSHSHDMTRNYESCFGLLDCFGLANNPMTRPHGLYQTSASFTGYQPLSTLEGNREGYVMNPSLPQDFKLPPMQTLNWDDQKPNHESWNRTGSPRTQIDDVRLNPKRSPRRSSRASSIASRRSHRSPSYGAVRPSLQLLQPHYTRPESELDVVYSVDTECDAPSRSSCNRPYNRAQIDWIRYFKIDLSLSYDSMDKPFEEQWPGESKSGHCFSARLYRDNWMPRVDASNNPMYDEKGKVKMDPAKMRDMKTLEGKEKCIPYSLVDRYPWRAVEYRWVREEDKERARAILRSDDPNDPTGSE